MMILKIYELRLQKKHNYRVLAHRLEERIG